MVPMISDGERVKLVATLASSRLDSIKWAADFVEAVEAELEQRVDARHATPPASGPLQIDDEEFRRAFRKWIDMPPVPAKPRTVEDWMRENDREPYCTSDDDACFWDAPNYPGNASRSIVPVEVFAKLRPSSLGGGRPGKTRAYKSRADAVADLREALLSLQLIAE